MQPDSSMDDAGWDESKHPRVPSGQSGGGQFGEGGREGSIKTAMRLIEQHDNYEGNSPLVDDAYRALQSGDVAKALRLLKEHDNYEGNSRLLDKVVIRLSRLTKDSAMQPNVKFRVPAAVVAQGFEAMVDYLRDAGWDESKHPRVPSGSAEGGQFGEGGSDTGVMDIKHNSYIERELKSEQARVKKLTGSTNPKDIISLKFAKENVRFLSNRLAKVNRRANDSLASDDFSFVDDVYESNADLPDTVRGALPAHAQSVFRAAYNSAHERDGATEESCNKIAWGAVKNAGYKKSGDGWVKDGVITDSLSMTETMMLDTADVRVTVDGFLAAMPRVARVGVQRYRGSEVGKPDKEFVNVYRPEEEVFDADSLRSYAHRPLTNNHPPVPVNSKNWKKYSIGHTNDPVLRDGQFIRVPTIMMDADAIAAYDAGKREMSLGYKTELVWDAGMSPDGQAYDAVMTKIRANHLAFVTTARGGSNLRLGDEEGESDMPKTLVVDGLPCEMTDQAALIVEKQIKTLSDAATTAQATATKAATDLAARDAELAVAKKQLLDEQIKTTPAALDALVQDRATVATKAKAVIGDALVVKDRTADDMRRQVVVTQLGDAAKSYTDAQIVSAFDAFTAKIGQHATNGFGGGSNQLADALSAHRPNSGPATKEAAMNDQDKYLTDAWRYPNGRPAVAAA